MKKNRLYGIVFLALAALLLVYMLIPRGHGPMTGMATQDHAASAHGEVDVGEDAGIGGPFTLTDQNGKTRSDLDFRGHYMLIYFGYTGCPDACPAALQTITTALDSLGTLANKVQPIFITVDPARDTPDKLRDYVSAFTPALIGLTGTQDQVDAVAAAYKVYKDKAPTEDPQSYLMNHSNFFYLMGPDGHFISMIDGDSAADDVAAALKAHVKTGE